MVQLLQTRAISIIERETRKARRPIFKSTEIIICCPFHWEKTPSCHINIGKSNIPIGFFHCLGCGAKGQWNVLANKAGWKRINEKGDKQILSLAPNAMEKMDSVCQALLRESGTEDWTDYEPDLVNTIILDMETDFRDIPKKLMVKLGCKRHIDSNGNTWTIIPVTIDDTLVGLVRGRFTPSPDKRYPNYLNSPGTWVKDVGLLGFDYARTLPFWKKYRILFLVEGPRDALAMLACGIPAAAILGSNNWTENKYNLIVEAEPALVVTLFDNDDAGRKAGKKVKESFTRVRQIPFKRILLPHKQKIGRELDPANLGKTKLKEIALKAKGWLKPA